jgi:hypothetical protein
MITALEEYEHIEFFKKVSIKFKFLFGASLLYSANCTTPLEFLSPSTLTFKLYPSFA